jgi:hypothetical protein
MRHDDIPLANTQTPHGVTQVAGIVTKEGTDYLWPDDPFDVFEWL